MVAYAPTVPTTVCHVCDGEGCEPCMACDGQGTRSGRQCNHCDGECWFPCADCAGAGIFLALRMGDVLCPLCMGAGTVLSDRPRRSEHECHVCEGHGLIQKAEA